MTPRAGPLAGALALTGSRKGTVFGGTAAVLLGLMVDGALPVPLGAKLLVVLASAHILGQGLADLGRGGARRDRTNL